MVGAGQIVLRSRGVKVDRLEAIGCRLARALQPGDLVLVYGPLGAGKTTFVRAVARALEVVGPIRSPSYTIANVYSGKSTVQHLDLYRLDQIGDDDALALEEYVGGDAITLVEWPEVGLEKLGEATWTVRLAHQSLTERSLEIEAATDQARERWEKAGSNG